ADNAKPLRMPSGASKLFYIQCWEPLPSVDALPPFGPNSRGATGNQNAGDAEFGGRATNDRPFPRMPNQPPPPRPPRPPDTLEIFIKSRGGETLSVDSPSGFASAVRRILARVGAK